MHKIGVWLLWLGLTLTLVGLFGGFALLFADYDQIAKPFLGLVPFGFLFLFTGIVITQFSQPNRS